MIKKGGMPFLLLSYVKALRVKQFFINDFDGKEEEEEEEKEEEE